MTEGPRCFPCDPVSREFPPDWKDVWFRIHAVAGTDGLPRLECPLCHRWFDHTQISFLQGDHIWPYSMFGETAWENYQLICGACNAAKSNCLDREVRRVLGKGEFRRMVHEYLCALLIRGELTAHPAILSILEMALTETGSITASGADEASGVVVFGGI